MTAIFIRERRGGFGYRDKGEDDQMKMEAEVGGMLSQAKEHQEPPEAGRSMEGSFLEPSGEI